MLVSAQGTTSAGQRSSHDNVLVSAQAITMKRWSRLRKQEKQQRKQTDLLDAVQNNDARQVFKLLRQGVSADAGVDSCSFSPSALAAACRLSNIEMAQMLLRHGADVNAGLTAVSRCGVTSPTVAAIDGGSVDVLLLLFTYRASPHMTFQCNQVNAKVTLLQYACIRGNQAFIRPLVNSGCDVEAES